MEELFQVVIDKGLGVASFIALLYFYFNFVNKINDTNQHICDTLESIEKNLLELTLRVEKIENKNKQEKF